MEDTFVSFSDIIKGDGSDKITVGPSEPITQVQEPQSAQETQEPVTQTTETTQEPVVQTTQEPVAQTIQETTPVQEAPKSWDAVLKESGFDEYDINLLKYKKETGSLKGYLEAYSVDYNKMTPEQVFRKKIQDDFPGISETALEYKLKLRLKDYPLDPDSYSEDEIKAGRELLELDANSVRQEYINKQQSFLEPVLAKAQEAQMAQLQEQQQLAQQVEAFKQSVLQNDFTRNLFSSKRLALEGTKDKFNYEMPNAAQAVDMVLDSSKWQQAVSNPDGSLKVDVLVEAANWVLNKKDIVQRLIDFGKTLGEKKVIEQDLTNAQIELVSQTATPDKTFLDALKEQWK